jgi:hypothetical protein
MYFSLSCSLPQLLWPATCNMASALCDRVADVEDAVRGVHDTPIRITDAGTGEDIIVDGEHPLRSGGVLLRACKREEAPQVLKDVIDEVSVHTAGCYVFGRDVGVVWDKINNFGC